MKLSSNILPSFSFENIGLHPKLLQALQVNGYVNPTEIQKQAVPEIIKGRDLLASAQTGAGKTLAFVLPALQLLLDTPPSKGAHGPRVLILTPTRELSQQITNAIAKINKFTHFKFGTVTGGVGYPAQLQLLRKPLDILVATPGRLMDHMSHNRVDFSRLTLFILDEADRMLDMGFIKDMEHIAKMLPAQHQTLLFSATLEGPVQNISRRFLQDPLKIQLTAVAKPNTLISQRIHLVDNLNHKRALLNHVLEEPGMWQAIVFTGTKRGADELAEELKEQGIECAALHGDMKQSKRSRTLERMHRGQLRVLVATDVAARGLDVKKLSHVINFDLPRSAEDYVHRIGRTGRCGEKGIAISLVGPKDNGLLNQIERLTGQTLERQTIPGLEPKTTFAPSFQPKSKSRAPKRGGQNNKRTFSEARNNDQFAHYSPKPRRDKRNNQAKPNTHFPSKEDQSQSRTQKIYAKDSEKRKQEGTRQEQPSSQRRSVGNKSFAKKTNHNSHQSAAKSRFSRERAY